MLSMSWHVPLSGHDDVHFLNDVINDAESTQKSKNYTIIASLKSETMGKLINRIPGSRLLISRLPGSALRSHVESLGKPPDVNKRSKSLATKLDIKVTHLVFSLSRQASRCQQAFSNSCLVNLISKDTHLVISISS